MGRAHTGGHEADCSGSARRCARALLLAAVTGLLVACGGGGVQPVGGGGSAGSSVALAWDAPVTPVSGYRIYYGLAMGTYLQLPGQGLNVGNTTTYTVTGLNGATTYYFAATSYDASNTESMLSNEVLKVTP